MSRFLASLLHAFAAAATPAVELVVLVCDNVELPPLPVHASIRYVPVRIGRLVVWEQVDFPRWIRRLRASVALPFTSRLSLLAGPLGIRYVMYLFEVPDYRLAANRVTATPYQRLSDVATRSLFPFSVRHASRIAVSSRATADDLVQRYGVPDERISIVYPAPDPMFRPSSDPGLVERVRARYGAPDGFVLHVSSDHDPRDNTATALDAFARLCRMVQRPPVLVIPGAEQLTRFGWGDRITRLGIGDRVRIVGFRPDRELVELYQAADAYLDTSLYEGFGFQVAEALVCGTPVVCSRTSSLPEIAGDAALLVDPQDAPGFAASLARILTDEVLRADLRRRAVRRMEQFSWRRCVDDLMATILAVPGGGRP